MNTLIDETRLLFSINYLDESMDENLLDDYIKQSEALIESNGWKSVYSAWFDYLKNECLSANEVINYVNLFVCYGGADYPISDPYDFLAILYSRVDMNEYWDKAGDVFDSLATSILEKQGLVNLSEDPYYNILDDPKLKEAISNL